MQETIENSKHQTTSKIFIGQAVCCLALQRCAIVPLVSQTIFEKPNISGTA